MSRKFAPISKDDLFAKIKIAFDSGHGICPYKMKEVLGGDIKVEFDFENFEFNEKHYNKNLAGLTGIVQFPNGLTIAGFTGGGDWECPVYFCVYWSGKKLRAYVPSEGNPWNTVTKQAYGNDDNADAKNAKKRWPEMFDSEDDDCEFDVGGLDFDGNEIKADILSRLQPA